MPNWLGELVNVDEAGTRDGRHSHGWKVSLSMTHGCVRIVLGVLAWGFMIYKGIG